MKMYRQRKAALTSAVILILASGILTRVVFAAEATRFLVSYGGTAGYQLPLWVNKGFIKGQIEGMHYVKTNKEGTLKVLRKHWQITDAEAVEGTYEFFAKRLPRSPRTELEGVKNILVSIDAGKKNPADFVDMSLIDEIEKEGFLQKLYGQ